MARLTTHLLIVTLIFGGVLASPAVMAWSMPSQGSSGECTLCQTDPASQQHSSATMIDCVASVCGSMVAIDVSMVALMPPVRVASVFDLRLHSGRLLQGPDPFPPRYTHA